MALEVLWDGPTAFFFSTHTVALSFSPDGEWLARGGSFDLALYSRATGRPTPLEGHQSIVAFGGFDSDGSRFCSSGFDNTVRLWSVPEGNLEATLPVDGPSSTYFGPAEDELTTASFVIAESLVRVRKWHLSDGASEVIAEFEHPFTSPSDMRATVDQKTGWFFIGRGKEVYGAPVEELPSLRLIGRHDEDVWRVGFMLGEDRVASVGISGEIRTWALEAGPKGALRVLGASEGEHDAETRLGSGSPDGRWLASPKTTATQLWDLAAPPVFDPIVLQHRDKGIHWAAQFDPASRWVVVGEEATNSLWPLEGMRSRTLAAHPGDRVTVAFAPDGESLFSAGAGVVRHWALNPERPFDSRVILELPAPVYFDVSPDGRSLLTGDFAGGVKIIPLDDSPKRSLKGFPFGEAIRDVSFSPSGRLVAAGAGALRAEDAVTRVWDLATGNAQTLDAGDGQMILDLEFVGEDRLATTGYGGLRLWDLSTGTSTLLSQDGIFKVSYGARDDVLLAAPVVGAGANLLRFDLSSGRVQEIPGRSGGGCPTGIRPRWSDRGLRCRPRQNPGGSG